MLPPFRRGKLVFANEKGRARKNCCRAPTKGQRERGGGGGWKQRFAETAANNYARNALIFAQLRKPITLSDATNFIPFSLSSSFSDISGRDELPSCLENWILFISTIYCLRPTNAFIYTGGSLSARLKPANYRREGSGRVDFITMYTDEVRMENLRDWGFRVAKVW